MAGPKLTKAAIIESLYEKHGLNRADIHKIIDEFFEEVKEGLKNDQVIELRGFGTFEVRDRKGRAKARNPKTGEIVSVKDHSVVAFRAGKDLKSSVWDLNDRKVAEKKD